MEAATGSYSDGLFPHCSCADFEVAGRDCKHMLAARQWSDSGEPPAPDHTKGIKPKPEPRIPQPTYPRDWPTINKAQTTEKHWFQTLLADLCRSIPEPPKQPRRGRPSIPLADGVFAACFKVYSGLSARRFTCDVQEARERGHIGHAPHFNSVLNVLESEAVTPILLDLIARSASPLREVETEFAIDSSGFSTSRFDRWFDLKYGVTRQEAHWVKVHVCCGTTTNVITAVEITNRDGGDAPQLPKLVEATAKGFRVERVTADKAYPSNANFEAVEKVGGVLYAAFKSNTTGAVGGLFEKAFHYFCLHREEFLRLYHRRSMIESTFSHGEAEVRGQRSEQDGHGDAERSAGEVRLPQPLLSGVGDLRARHRPDVRAGGRPLHKK